MKSIFAPLITFFLFTACGGGLSPNAAPNAAVNLESTLPGGLENSARIIFSKDNFTDLSDFVTARQTNFKCLGDVVKTYYTTGDDYMGTPHVFPLDPTVTDDFLPTTRPSFIKNVSVDITNTYFSLTTPNALLTDACSYRGVNGTSGASACADFDEAQTVTPTPTIAPTPTASPYVTPSPTPSSTPYYGTPYYRVRDDWCAGEGPILSSNVDTTRTHVGGVSIDLDRTQLGPMEDLLMMVTYQAYNANSAWPSAQGIADETILEVDLIGTGLGLDLLIGAKQPRPWTDYASPDMPVYLKQLATLRDPVGSLRTEQIYLPLSQNALIDRIRLERVRGSYHLYQIDLYRLGNRAPDQ